MKSPLHWLAPILAVLTPALLALGPSFAAEPAPPAPPPAGEPPTAPPPSLEINLLHPPGAPPEEPSPEIKPDLEKSAELNNEPPPAPAATPVPEPTPEKKAEAAPPPPVPEATPTPAPKETEAVKAKEPEKKEENKEAEAAPAPPPTAESPRPPEEAPKENVVAARPKRNPRVPWYTLTRPQWGFEIIGSPKALGGQDLVAGQNGSPTRAIGLQLEYQPKFIQAIGVLSLGPSFLVYPISADAGVTANVAGLYSLGGQIRYQARFFREQPLVPIAGFEVQYIKYSFSSGAQGALTATGPFYGIWLLLNLFEPSAAAENYINNGVSRTYLVAEIHQLQGSNSDLSFSQGSAFFGLRFEF